MYIECIRYWVFCSDPPSEKELTAQLQELWWADSLYLKLLQHPSWLQSGLYSLRANQGRSRLRSCCHSDGLQPMAVKLYAEPLVWEILVHELLIELAQTFWTAEAGEVLTYQDFSSLSLQVLLSNTFLQSALFSGCFLTDLTCDHWCVVHMILLMTSVLLQEHITISLSFLFKSGVVCGFGLLWIKLLYTF